VVALDPIIEAIRTHVMSAERIHADDTTVPVLAKLKTVTGRIGPMSAMTGRLAQRPTGGSVSFYSRSRAGEHAATPSCRLCGLMQADAV